MPQPVLGYRKLTIKSFSIWLKFGQIGYSDDTMKTQVFFSFVTVVKNFKLKYQKLVTKAFLKK